MTGETAPNRPVGDPARRLGEIDTELRRLSTVLMVGMPMQATRAKFARLQAEGADIRAELGLPPDPRYSDPPQNRYAFFWLLLAGVVPALIFVDVLVTHA